MLAANRYLRSSKFKIGFNDTYFSRDDRYFLGIESTSGRHYVSIPVSNGIVDYEGYYEITPDQHHALQVTETRRLNL